jgi:hypothetical protein
MAVGAKDGQIARKFCTESFVSAVVDLEIRVPIAEGAPAESAIQSLLARFDPVVAAEIGGVGHRAKMRRNRLRCVVARGGSLCLEIEPFHSGE